MIRFPNIQCLTIDDLEKSHLYSKIYDIFIAYKNETVNNIFRATVQTEQVQQIQLITQPSDILLYKDLQISKEQKLQNIQSQFESKTIYEYAGFQIISQTTPAFKNIFLTNQNIKQTTIELIKRCEFISNKQDYIDSVLNIPDNNQELLLQYKDNIQQKIEKETFDNMVTGIIHMVGGFISQVCDGQTKIPGTNVRLPPMQGCELDILELYKSQKIQTDFLCSLKGMKLMKYSTDPFVKCFVCMASRIYQNNKKLKLQEQRIRYRQKRQQEQRQKQRTINPGGPNTMRQNWNQPIDFQGIHNLRNVYGPQ